MFNKSTLKKNHYGLESTKLKKNFKKLLYKNSKKKEIFKQFLIRGKFEKVTKREAIT